MSSSFQKTLETHTERFLLYKKPRWVFTISTLLTYLARTFYLEKDFAVSYLLGFHIMKMSIGFLTPKGIPSIIEEDLDEDIGLCEIDTVE
jgi:hypothetical protein